MPGSGMYGSAICAMWIAVCTRVVTCDLLEGVLQRERVHDRGEHAHVVRAARSMRGSLRPRQMLPPPTTTAVWTPRSTTSASWRASSAVASALMP